MKLPKLIKGYVFRDWYLNLKKKEEEPPKIPTEENPGETEDLGSE